MERRGLSSAAGDALGFFGIALGASLGLLGEARSRDPDRGAAARVMGLGVAAIASAVASRGTMINAIVHSALATTLGWLAPGMIAIVAGAILYEVYDRRRSVDEATTDETSQCEPCENLRVSAED
jgi:hypothetical protein